MDFNAMLMTDFYKVSHKEQYPDKTEVVYTTFTPRGSRIKGLDRVVAYGFQYVIKEKLIKFFNDNFFNRPLDEVVEEYKRVLKFALGQPNPDADHIAALHKLGFLPLRITAVREGTMIPLRVPMMTVENTRPEFFWLTNFVETLLSAELWHLCTSATIAKQYRTVLDKWAIETTGTEAGVELQGHDFAQRGMGNMAMAASSGSAHLLSFAGTDTIPAILFLEKYYDANIEEELVGTSIPATEHSVMCANADNNQDEYHSFKRLLTEIYPRGLFSAVSDSYDFWKVVDVTIPSLKEEIMNRDGKFVIRPDSGNPVDILCGEHIQDLTDEIDSPEEAEDIFADEIREIEDLAGDGFYGDEDMDFTFKFKDKYYKMTMNIEYNRHDRRYYFVESVDMKEYAEVTPTAEQLGLIESLWNTFGGTINEQGYKQLDSHVGAIYGDSITVERAEQICQRLAAKGFASTNVVLGIGSFTYQYNTRDTFMFALKATYIVVDGEERMIFKDPKTGDGTKRSQRGMVAVTDNGGEISYVDGLTRRTYDANFSNLDILEEVFLNGKLMREQPLANVRNILAQQ